MGDEANRELAELLARYRAAAMGTDDSDTKRQHRCADTVHACYKALRQTEDGRKGLAGLMSDPSPSVRVWAASHSLAWAPATARATLESIRTSGVFPHAFDADITLEEFDKGTLSFDH